MDIEIVLKNLYASEINCAISCFWDNGFDVKFGDEMNGVKAEGNVRTLDEAANFLDRQARIHCPESVYALESWRTDGAKPCAWQKRQEDGSSTRICPRARNNVTTWPSGRGPGGMQM